MFTFPFTMFARSSDDPYYSNVILLISPDESNGSTSTIDHSPIGNTIVFSGNTIVSTTQTKFAPSALYFDGANNTWATVSDSANFNMSGDFTWEFWLYRTAVIERGGANDCPLSFSVSSTSTEDPAILLAGAGPYRCIYYTNTDAITTSNVLTLNAWHFIQIIRSSGVVRIYLDGVQSGGNFSNATTINPDRIAISTSINGFGEMQGYLGEMRLTKDVARSPYVPTARFI